MIDLHAHILPGLDDGAWMIEDARDLARRVALVQITAASLDGRLGRSSRDASFRLPTDS
jgi:tyrosine-protein phosphatase YwqE